MTLVIAWKYNGAAFIVGDSAITHTSSPRSQSSSFGELQLDDGLAVEEMAPKVLRLAPDVVVGWSGNLVNAERFMSLTVRLLAEGIRLEKAVEDASIALDTDGKAFQLVFAFVGGGVPQLLHYSSAGGDISKPEERCLIGGAPESLARETWRRVEGVVAVGRLTDDMVIAAALTHLQALGIHIRLPTHRIGGAFFGACLHREHGAVWQPPITYVLHPPNLFDAETFRAVKSRGPSASVALVQTRVHDEAGIVFSSLLDNTLRILPSPWTGMRTQREWADALTKLYPTRKVLIPDDNTEYFAFLDTGKQRGLLLKRRPRSSFPLKIDRGHLLFTKSLADEINRNCDAEFDLRLIDATDS